MEERDFRVDDHVPYDQALLRIVKTVSGICILFPAGIFLDLTDGDLQSWVERFTFSQHFFNSLDRIFGKVMGGLVLAFDPQLDFESDAFVHSSSYGARLSSGTHCPFCITSICMIGWTSQMVPRVFRTWSGCSGSKNSQPLIRTRD